MLAYLPIYLIWFVLAEKFITDGYYVSYMPFDDKIPFIPVFVLPYVMWYPYILAPIPALYFIIPGDTRKRKTYPPEADALNSSRDNKP